MIFAACFKMAFPTFSHMFREIVPNCICIFPMLWVVYIYSNNSCELTGSLSTRMYPTKGS